MNALSVLPYDRAFDTSTGGTSGADYDNEVGQSASHQDSDADPESRNAGDRQGCGSSYGGSVQEKRYLLTEGGFARRIRDTYGSLIRYRYDAKQWYFWNSQFWQQDTEEFTFLMKCSGGVVKRMIEEAQRTGDVLLYKHALKCDTASRLTSVFRYLQSLLPVRANSDQFDADLSLFNCENGTLNLATGEFFEHRKEDLITKMAPVSYDLAATYPMWEETLETVFHGDRELIGYFGRAVGYAITGSCSEKAVFVEHGPSANNGKTTVMHAIRRVLGDEQYALEFDPTMLLSTKNSGGYRPRGDIAALNGIRLAEGEELDGNQEIDRSLVKRISGGADTRIRARDVYRAAASFVNTATIFLSTNSVLRARVEPAIVNRLFIIPFDTVFVNTEEEMKRRKESGQQYVGLVDRHRQERLDAERSGILNWMLRHCLDYRAQGLNPSAAAIEAKDRYIKMMDVVGCFIDECGELDLKAKTTVGDLWTRYQCWCKECGESPMRRTDFTSELQNKGVFKTDEKIDGRYWYKGIRLKA